MQNTPVVPVFQAVLPNGKVLMWDSVGDKSVDTYPDHTFTRAVVWDPATDTSKQVNVSGYNIFCAGFAQLADGRVLVAGGNKNPAQDGIVQTHIFDWRTETWTRGPDMNAARWYPVGGGARQRGGADRRRRTGHRGGVSDQQRAAPVDRLHQLRPTGRTPSWCPGPTGRSSWSARTTGWTP